MPLSVVPPSMLRPAPDDQHKSKKDTGKIHRQCPTLLAYEGKPQSVSRKPNPQNGKIALSHEIFLQEELFSQILFKLCNTIEVFACLEMQH